MSTDSGDGKRWRQRAVEARTIGEQMKDADTRRQMFEMAHGCDKIAERFEKAGA